MRGQTTFLAILILTALAGVSRLDAQVSLSNGVPEGGSVAADGEELFTISVPSDAIGATFELDVPSPNLDLYVRPGQAPDVDAGLYHDSSTKNGAADEQIAVNNPETATWYVTVADANSTGGSFTVTASYEVATASTGDMLYQGTENVDVTLTGSDFNQASGVDMGADITVNSYNVVNDSTITANVDVPHLTDAGSRLFTVNLSPGSRTGKIHVEFPTNILPDGGSGGIQLLSTTTDEPSRNPAIGGVNVFLVNGAFFKSETDLATRGRMMGISWSRFYRSDVAYDGPLGYGWHGHYFQRVDYDDVSDDITWYTADGRTELFEWNSTDWDSPVGVYVEADRDSGSGEVTLTDRHGFVCTFNDNGRLIECTDRNGNSTTCTYNGSGQLIEVTDDRGYDYEITYYGHGRVHEVKDYVWDDSTPRIVEYDYDGNGNLISQKAPETSRYNDSDGNRTTYEYDYDGSHQLTECTNPREVEAAGSSYLENTYDGSGRVIEQRLGTSGQNIYLRYTDDGSGNDLVRVFDRRDLRTDYTLDSDGRATKVERFTSFWEPDLTAPINHGDVTEIGSKVRSSDPASYDTSFNYNSNHEITGILYPRRNSVEYTYQSTGGHLASGNVTEVRRKDNALGSLSDIVSTYTYESDFQFVKTATNPRGHTTTYTYDYEEMSPVTTAGNLIEVEAEDVDDGQPSTQSIVTTTEYNTYGQPTLSTDGEGNETEYVYYTSGDNDGFLKQRIVAEGDLDITSEYEYDRVGNAIATWSPRAFEPSATKDNFKTTYTVNELNQTVHVEGKLQFIGESDRTETYSYFDLNGNRTETFREYITYGGIEPSQPSDPDDPGTFPKNSNAMAATWVESSAVYNLLNRVTSSTVDAIAGGTVTQYTTTYQYDDNYNRTLSVTPEGIRTETVLDERDLTFQSIRAEGAGVDIEGTFETDYDDNGNVSASRDALDNETTYTYDGFDRTTQVTDPAGHYRTTEYDANSNVTASKAFNSSATLLAHSRSFYDEIDRAWKSEQLAKDHSGTNIGDGWRTTTTLYDKNSRVMETTDDNGVTTEFEYDGANRTTLITSNVGDETENEYNLEGVVTKSTYREMNGLTSTLEVSHTERDVDYLNRTLKFRDQRYNVSTRDTEVETVYDGWGRTIKTIDAADTETSYEYDLLSRTTESITRPGSPTGQWVVLHYDYDDDSRTTDKTIWINPGTFSVGQTTSYDYDDRNRLIELTRPDNDEWEFDYDAQNRTGWTDPLGTTVVDNYDSRNLVTQREIARGTGIKGATSETYSYDGLGRLLTAHNFEDRGGNEEKITEQEWEYNTLSLPETHTQQGWTSQDNRLGPAGGYTTEARYDALGLTVGNEFSNGRSLTHNYDGLNRLQETLEDATLGTVASYLYSGRRLIEREYGNGITTTYDYESSGCGCGGFSALVENVEHEDGSGQTLFQTERRYDVLGNVTAERRAHQGNYGEVHRFDDAYRLTDEYWGTHLGSTNLDTYADPANTPTTFSFQRTYNLDTRGNRVGDIDAGSTVDGVTDRDSSGNILRGIGYMPDADTNVYDSVDGQSFSFDTVEQMTYDPTTGLYHAYDYKGQLTETDDDSDFSSPERRYFYDTHGRLRIEERWYNPMHSVVFSIYGAEGMGGACGGVQQMTATEHLQFAGGSFSSPASVVQRIDGAKATGSGSATGMNPQAVAALPGRGGVGGGVIVENIDKNADSEIDGWHYHHEDQLGTLRGMSDENGIRIAEIDTGKYGQVFQKDILYDGRPSHVEGVTYIDEEEVTRIDATDSYPFPETVEGAVLRAVNANGAWTAIVLARHPDGDWIEVDDALSEIQTALDSGGDFVIFDNRRGSVSGGAHTGGTWGEPIYNAGADTTALYDSGSGTFDGYMTGWHVQIDAAVPVYFEILDANTDNISVAGDVAGLFTPGETEFCIIHPVGVDPETGATQEDLCVPESRYIWGGGLYLPPVAGFIIGEEFLGGQPGSNMSGQHYMWNRVYDINTGRWTTPDPAAQPWWNLQGYLRSNPINRKDPSGLCESVLGSEAAEWLDSVADGRTIGDHVHANKVCEALDEYWEYAMQARWTRDEDMWSCIDKIDRARSLWNCDSDDPSSESIFGEPADVAPSSPNSSPLDRKTLTPEEHAYYDEYESVLNERKRLQHKLREKMFKDIERAKVVRTSCKRKVYTAFSACITLCLAAGPTKPLCDLGCTIGLGIGLAACNADYDRARDWAEEDYEDGVSEMEEENPYPEKPTPFK